MKLLLPALLLISFMLTSSFLQPILVGSGPKIMEEHHLTDVDSQVECYNLSNVEDFLDATEAEEMSSLSGDSLIQFLRKLKKEGYCDYKCNARCSKAGVSDRCLKYCGICCVKCKCVPSGTGTYGNKHECPCYRDQMS